jgi:hypothetical protein
MQENEKNFCGRGLSREIGRLWVEMKNRGLKIGEILGSLTY